MKKKLVFSLLFLVSTFFCFAESLKFEETWGYLLTGYENEFSASSPITDLCYFSAEINEYGEIPSIPDRKKIPAEYKGKVHLVAICESRSLSHFVLDPKYDGRQMAVALVTKRDSKNFRKFLISLKKGIGPNKILSVCVAARNKTLSDDVYDYKMLASCVDKIFIMAYDQHWITSTPGPVAGMEWSKKIADYAKETIPPEKLVFGIPFYGRTWTSENFSKSWYNSGINRILNEHNSPKIERKDSIPHFKFKTEITVTGWFDDKESLEKRCEMLKSKEIKNIGFWRLGLEDKEFWHYLENNIK